MIKNIVELDKRGNINIPAELRNKLKITEGTAMAIEEQDKGLLLKKLSPECIFCGCTENVIEKISKFVCVECVDDLKQKF